MNTDNEDAYCFTFNILRDRDYFQYLYIRKGCVQTSERYPGRVYRLHQHQVQPNCLGVSNVSGYI